MAGQKGRSGSGGKRKGAGRPKGAVDAQPRFRIAKSLSSQKWEFAKNAQQYADKMLDVLVAVANNVEAPEATRVSAASKVLDRALGKAPKHGDVAALRHTEIVYRSAAELRQELINEGVPEVLLDCSLKDANGK
ncbi:MAG: hypothetical protein WCB70_22390 [Xanthobacteraceae bacterium]